MSTHKNSFMVRPDGLQRWVVDTHDGAPVAGPFHTMDAACNWLHDLTESQAAHLAWVCKL